MRLLNLISSRSWNRLLVGMVILLLLVLVAGGFYDNARINGEQARTDAILQGKLNLATAAIDANGLTLAQAEQDISRILSGEHGDITALQQEVAALQAQDAQLEQEIAALQAALGLQAQSPSPNGKGVTAPPTASARPSSKPTPTPRTHSQTTPAPTLTPIVCVSIICIGAQQTAADQRCPHHCKEKP